MKLLAVFLALAIVTGSQASVVRHKRATKIEEWKQNLEEYLGNITRTFLDQVEVVRGWETYRELKKQSVEGFANFSRDIWALEDELPEELSQTLERVVHAVGALSEKVFDSLHGQAQKMRPATEQLADTVLVVVAPYTDPVVEKVRTYADALRASLPEMRKAHSEKLQAYMGHLETHVVPRVKGVQSWLQGVRETLRPIVVDASQYLRKDAQRATDALKPYMGPLLEKAKEYATDLKKRLDSATALQHQ